MSANVPVSVSSASVCCAPPGLNGQAWLQPMHTVVGNYAIAALSLLLFLLLSFNWRNRGVIL